MSTNIVCENVVYAIGDKHLIRGLSLSLGYEKTGLVGNNGVGKTTLIRLLMGELRPQAGTIRIDGLIGYLPQTFVTHGENSIATTLGIEHTLAAVEKINAGRGSVADFDLVGDDWDVRARAILTLKKVNLDYLDLSRKIATLSGGETTRVFLARVLMSNPDFLILDEPTNNLDRDSRQALYQFITTFTGGVLVASHDRELLSRMDNIVELTTRGIKKYGGNYAAYVEQKEVEQAALQQDVSDAQKQLKKTQKVVQQTKERYEKRLSSGTKESRQGGQAKIFLDYNKGRAEKTKSVLESRTDKQVDSARKALREAQLKVEQKESLEFDRTATRVHASKVVLDIRNLSFSYPQAMLPLIDQLNWQIVGPQRVSLEGPNGSGKTTLLKLIMKQLEPLAGSIHVGVERYVYLDQALSLLDNTQTVIENFRRLNPEVSEVQCRLRLATFLFSHDAVDKHVEVLSGGEKMRLALACIFMSDTPPQLVILDEPTNNMDLESISTLERALKNFQGSLIVVSHDQAFLEAIGINDVRFIVKK